MINIEQLLQPIREDSACGDPAQGSATFVDLEKAKKGEPDRQFYTDEDDRSGPDWKEVKTLSLELLNHTRDLQVLSYLSMALLHTEGLKGFCTGISLIRQSLDTFWECMYPELDQEDPEDPAWERTNVLSELSHISFILQLRKQPIISARMLGAFSLNEIQAAYNPGTADSGEEAPRPEHVDGVFTEMGQEGVAELAQSVSTGMDDLTKIEELFKERAAPLGYPDLSNLHDCLKEITLILNQKAGDTEAEAETSAPQSTDGTVGDVNTGAQNIRVSAAAHEINNRGDVIKAIDKICDYYTKNEPGSPVPLLLNRAKKMVDQDFMQIVQELSPDSVNQMQYILGVSNEDDY